ncbi:MAG: hypothetical protein BGO26_14410 [Actinobacteria bacterium 69-20]|nr:VapC toxin family PIN domain ribonuclease [Actinomycetota bacterium]OJV29513.1 MAG: hypothetical protein BGO26_14410 [Actinobacteria bacterium 69-20]
MTLIIDAAPVVAMADRNDPIGKSVLDILEQESGDLIVPAPVSAEIDYLLGVRLGRASRLAFLDDCAAGRFTVSGLTRAEHGTVRDLEQQFADLDAGLADLSVVVLAHRYGTRRVLTFDQRDFRVLRLPGGDPLTLLPYDAP